MKKFFLSQKADISAREILGKVLVRKINGKEFRARIVEVEAYFDENDPASWARFGKRKNNLHMWSEPGTLLIKKVHKYDMLNLVAGKRGVAGAVLIRSLEPLNFEGRCNGPGLLTIALKINKKFNGKSILNNKEIWLEDSDKKFEISKSKRIGIRKDLKGYFRFYIKNNEHVSRK